MEFGFEPALNQLRTSWRNGIWLLVRISDAGLKRAARGSLKVQDPKNRQKFAIWAPSHKIVGLCLRN